MTTGPHDRLKQMTYWWLLLLCVATLVVSCRSPHPKTRPVIDLGGMVLSDGVPSDNFFLGSGKSVMVTATALRGDRLELQIDLYQQQIGGSQKRIATNRVRAHADQPAVVPVSGVDFRVIPRLKPGLSK